VGLLSRKERNTRKKKGRGSFIIRLVEKKRKKDGKKGRKNVENI
jgi:hypothetical protein